MQKKYAHPKSAHLYACTATIHTESICSQNKGHSLLKKIKSKNRGTSSNKLLVTKVTFLKYSRETPNLQNMYMQSIATLYTNKSTRLTKTEQAKFQLCPIGHMNKNAKSST